MKRFEFSMQKVLEYKDHMKDKEKNVLMQMRSRYEELYNEIMTMQKGYDHFNDDYIVMCQKGMSIKEIAIAKTYMAELADRIERMYHLLQKVAQEIDVQLDRVIEVSKEKNSMEKLKDRYYLVYREQRQKEMEIFIDDFVANTNHVTSCQMN